LAGFDGCEGLGDRICDAAEDLGRGESKVESRSGEELALTALVIIVVRTGFSA